MHRRLLTIAVSALILGLTACATGQPEDDVSAAGSQPGGTAGDLGAQFSSEPDVPGRAEPRYPSLGAPGSGGVAGPAAFSEWDANGDGLVTREEAKGQAIEPAFDEMDQDRDGRVSAQEFGLYQETYGPSLDRPRP